MFKKSFHIQFVQKTNPDSKMFYQISVKNVFKSFQIMKNKESLKDGPLSAHTKGDT